jgi:hypothetical protein
MPQLQDTAHRALGAEDGRLPSGARTLHQARNSGGVDLPRWTHHNRYLVPDRVDQQVYLHPYPRELMLRNHVWGYGHSGPDPY